MQGRRPTWPGCLLAVAIATGPAGAQEPGAVEWPYVGGDQAHSKYSALADIDRANVGNLEIAWEWDAGELPLPEYGTRPGRFEATPLMIDDTLYVSTMYARVVALDAETGAERWRFDPETYRLGGRARPRAGSSTGASLSGATGTTCACS